MIRRHIFMSAAMAAIALSGCSGGGDDDASPTPTPTGTASPTPTASPSYSAFPISTATEYVTFDATTSYTGDPATSAVTLGAAGTEMRSDRVRLAIDPSPTATTSIFVIRENVEESRFVSTNIQTPSATGNPEFSFRTDDATTAGKFAQFELLNNSVPGTVTSDAALALTRVSYGNWWRGDSTAGAKRLTYSIFGYPSVPSDLPTTGTVPYTARVVGRLISTAGAATTITRVTGTVTVSANFATGVVDVTMALSTLPPGGGPAVPYANFTMQGAVPVGQNQFNGSFTTGSPLSGTIVGGFFGSAGEQVGVTFAASGTIGGAQQRLIGDIVGKK